jgi:ribosomal protein S3AE
MNKIQQTNKQANAHHDHMAVTVASEELHSKVRRHAFSIYPYRSIVVNRVRVEMTKVAGRRGGGAAGRRDDIVLADGGFWISARHEHNISFCM